MRRVATCVFGCLFACKAAPNAIEGALLGTALGAAASGVSRATGGCYSSCGPGYRCDEGSGLCVASDCGVCGTGEYCDYSGRTPRCVARVERPERVAVPQGQPTVADDPTWVDTPSYVNEYWQAARPPMSRTSERAGEAGVLRRGPVKTATAAKTDTH